VFRIVVSFTFIFSFFLFFSLYHTWVKQLSQKKHQLVLSHTGAENNFSSGVKHKLQ